jgi:hypothetical protein
MPAAAFKLQKNQRSLDSFFARKTTTLGSARVACGPEQVP